jgi:hypothetical protein
MKTLNEIEPGTPIESLTGTATEEYVVDKPGRYFMTASHAIAAGKTGIKITTSDVTLDMRGFTLQGATSVAGVFIGVYATAARVVVENGTVNNFPYVGAYLAGTSSALRNMRADGNGLAGLAVADAGIVSHCTATNNGGLLPTYPGIGILAGTTCVIKDNTVINVNGGESSPVPAAGIRTSYRCVVSGNSVNNVTTSGTGTTAYCIQVTRSEVSHNQASGATSYYGGTAAGIYAQAQSTVSYNDVSSISAWYGGTARGIEATDTTDVQNNQVTWVNVIDGDGTSSGIYAGDQVRVVNNTVCQTGASNGGNVSGFNIYANGQQCTIEGNQCQTPFSLGTGISANIRAGHMTRVSNNYCASNSTSTSHYGILVDATACVITGNVCENNLGGDIRFTAAASRGYAGGNITSNAITQETSGNVLNGTTPSANVVH